MQPGPTPVVSVILVNYRSPDDTLAAIEGLRALDWPAEALEVVVVDNASADASVERITARAPDVRLIEAERNLGFAGGCNLGVASSTGTHVAFLNNDARPDRAWVRAAVEVLEEDRSIGCVASKVLDWEGRTIDFAAAGMAFDGQGYKLHVGEPDGPVFDEPADVLFASGAAMVMPRSVFDELGGFDERFFMFFEDVDLGWRTWLAGYRVRYVPRSIAYHRHHATMKRYGSWFEQYLLTRNALATIYKNYDDHNLARVLPAALLLATRRATTLGGLDRHSLDLERGPVLDDVPAAAVSKQTLATLYALDGFTDLLPDLQEARRRIQAGRRRTDAEITRLFRLPLRPNIGDPAYGETFAELTRLFGVDGVFAERRRIVVATADTLTPRMAGPAIRAWNMAKALSREHDVRLVTKGHCEITHPDFETRGGVGPEQWVELEAWCDVVVFQGFLLHEVPALARSGKVIVADLYDPFHLEQLELFRHEPLDWRTNVIGDSVRVLNEQILRGDFFLCASDKQRDFWLGQLSAMQRVNPYVYDRDESLEQLLTVVPFGVPDEPPERTGPGIRGVVPGIGHDDKVVIWGGGIYNWFDPLTLIRAVDRLRARVPNVRLYFMGTKHPNPDVAEMRVAWEARELAERLGLLGSHVFFNDGWVPYEQRQNHLLDADLGVTTHLDHVETAFSFRTRVLDYFWASLPVVSTEGDTLASLVERRGLGLTVPAEDVEALEEALHRLLTDEAFAAECRVRVRQTAEEFRWSRVLAPLVEFCRRAERAPDALHRQALVREDAPTPGLLGRFLIRAAGKVDAARAVRAEQGALAVARRGAGYASRKASALVRR